MHHLEVHAIPRSGGSKVHPGPRQFDPVVCGIFRDRGVVIVPIHVLFECYSLRIRRRQARVEGRRSRHSQAGSIQKPGTTEDSRRPSERSSRR